MTQETTCLVDDNGIQVFVAWKKSSEGMELESFEVVVDGRAIDIVHSLTQAQHDAVCEQLNFLA
jgi:hypothetical protein